MAFVLDNLTAVLVGATLLGALMFVQQRGQHASVEATTRYRAQQMTDGFATTLERDVDNIRTQAQTEAAFVGGTPNYRFSLRRSGDGSHTTQFAFPTLADPSLGTDSPIAIVAYHTTPTGKTATIAGESRPLYEVTRYVYMRGASAPVATATLPDVVDFDVRAFSATGDEVPPASLLSPTPRYVTAELVTTLGLSARRAADQDAASGMGTTRQSRTVWIPGATSTGGLPTGVATDLPGGIPAFPGDGGGSTGTVETPAPAPAPEDVPTPEPVLEPEPEPPPSPKPTPSLSCRLFRLFC